MLLMGTIYLGSVLTGPMSSGSFALFALPTLIVGYGLAVAEWRLRRPWATVVLSLLTVEELLVWALATASIDVRDSLFVNPVNTCIFAYGCALVIILWLRIPLPARGLPLRGIWLRRLLALSALGALIHWSVWLEFFQQAWMHGEFLWPVLPGIFAACYCLFRSADTLARHSQQRDGERASPAR